MTELITHTQVMRDMLARMLYGARRELALPSGDWDSYVDLTGGACRIAERMDNVPTLAQVTRIDEMLWGREIGFFERPDSGFPLYD